LPRKRTVKKAEVAGGKREIVTSTWKNQLRMHGNELSRTVRVAPSGALNGGISHVVNKDGKISSAEARPRAAKVVSAGRSTVQPPLRLKASPSLSTSTDII